MSYSFRAPMRRSTGEAAWYFITLPFDVADDIAERSGESRRGFGSVRVSVTVGATTWATSVFPSNEAESYVLPVKKAVRTTEGLEDGEPVSVVLELVDPAG